MRRVATVLLHYWPERSGNVRRIIRDLWMGSIRPDEIIVFNNNKDVTFESKDGVLVVNSNHNFYCQVRHAMGLMTGAEYCFFIDDDLTVGRKTLEYLLNQMGRFPESILGFEGRRFGEDAEKPYSSGENVMNLVDGPTPMASVVDIVKGRLHICKTLKLLNAFRLKHEVGLQARIDDDVVLSLANKIFDAGTNLVVSTNDETRPMDLADYGVGLYHIEGHIEKRDETCKRIMAWDIAH